MVFNSDSTTYNTQFGNVGPAEGSTLTAQNTAWDGLNYSTSFASGKFSLIILARV